MRVRREGMILETRGEVMLQARVLRAVEAAVKVLVEVTEVDRKDIAGQMDYTRIKSEV